jgi:hypothetical protein
VNFGSVCNIFEQILNVIINKETRKELQCRKFYEVCSEYIERYMIYFLVMPEVERCHIGCKAGWGIENLVIEEFL